MRDSASGIETTKKNRRKQNFCILHWNIWKHLEPHSELILHFLILTVVSGYVHQATHVTSIFDILKNILLVHYFYFTLYGMIKIWKQTSRIAPSNAMRQDIIWNKSLFLQQFIIYHADSVTKFWQILYEVSALEM